MDVIRGYNKSYLEKFGTFYLKHIDLFSSEEIDERKKEYENHAKSKGLPTEEEKLKDLEKEGLWSSEKDTRIKECLQQASALKITKSKFILQADMDSIQKQIENIQQEHAEIASEKLELVGYTVESYATKKVNEFFIYTTSYKDIECTVPLFSREVFEEIHEKDIFLLIANYNTLSAMYSDDNLKRVALSGFFLNSFYLCEDNPFIFYGRPVVELTFNQNELFSFGKYFKHILSELKHDPDPETMSDPDKLIDLFNVSKNSDKIKQKMDESSATTVVGATQEDMKRMGLTSGQPDGAVSLAKAAAEKGGSLDMNDLIKLHGE